VDTLFAALSYLDAFCVSDYFPALVGLDLDGHERVVRGVMRTLGRLHDPVVEERVEEWRRLRKAGERREPADFLDVLASLDDAAGRPLLTVEEIKAHVIYVCPGILPWPPTQDIMIATVDNPSNAAEWALAEMVNRLVSLLSVLPQLKFWASYATGLRQTNISDLVPVWY